MKTVLIVDGRPDILWQLQRLFVTRYHVLTAANAQRALQLLDEPRRAAPALAILDLRVAAGEGKPLLRALAEREIPIILLSCFDDLANGDRHIEAYVVDVLAKPFGFDKLLSRVESLFSESSAPGGCTTLSLTPRQAEILTMLARGASDREIAHALGLSQRTVKWHIQEAGQRLGANGRIHAVSIALRHGLLPKEGVGDR